MAVAFQEPGVGFTLDNLSATATKNGSDSYTLTGSKSFVANGVNADVFMVLVKTGHGTKHNSFSWFMVDKSDVRSCAHDIQGTWSAGWSKVTLEGVHVNVNALVGELHRGFSMFQAQLPRFHLLLSGLAISNLRLILSECMQ
mmetsp:Transcript_109837/g.236368  ORF Transcript_109837/g.236368 Transcript_109837/m.236368 type:complete len:142 (+) Transcript_109837:446-871(+)